MSTFSTLILQMETKMKIYIIHVREITRLPLETMDTHNYENQSQFHLDFSYFSNVAGRAAQAPSTGVSGI